MKQRMLQAVDALCFIALYSILLRYNDGWGAEKELACEQVLHLGEGNEPRENARAGTPRCRVSSRVPHVRVLKEIPQMESLLAGVARYRQA